jgi:hypothetical protein
MATMFKAIGENELSENAARRVRVGESHVAVKVQHASDFSRMKAIVEEALADDQSIDLGPLSHEERLKVLLSR